MKSSLDWCTRQKKGLRLVDPSEILAEVFFKKAESSLNMLKSAIEKNETDWIVTTSYYSKYFALYALLTKCGIKCEIHDCTITAMKALFVDAGLVRIELYDDIEQSKELRVNMQYYAYKEFDKEKVMKLAQSAPDFVLGVRKAYEQLDQKNIDDIRTQLNVAVK